MYAFGPLPKYKKSGRIIGTHQKIDRIARRHLASHLDDSLVFPRISEILHFEGSRGPDGVKLKSPGKDEPWHFIDPSDVNDTNELFTAIADHRENLTEALVAKNHERAAFEAAWLAHAVVDGLTPAHHEPLDEQTEHLKHADEKKYKVRSKVIMSGGGSAGQFLANNWDYWGAKGLMTNHTLFEAGIAVAAKPLKFTRATLSQHDFDSLDAKGFLTVYGSMIKEIASLDMYEQFKQTGWTTRLAQQTTGVLLPTIVRAVTLAWYDAYTTALVRRGE
ncbi:MAG TPA: hypothetical protein VGE34_01840 [Candidatus Saccharimonadales bacterium]